MGMADRPSRKDASIGIRLEEDERAALERAAAADDRPLSALARKMIVDALRRGGWLAKVKKGPRK
jgi:uncharacterized protein (DUF1778 family)